MQKIVVVLVLSILMTACTTTRQKIPAITFHLFLFHDCRGEEMDSLPMNLWYWNGIDRDAIRDYLTLLREEADVERMKTLRDKSGGMRSLAKKSAEKTDFLLEKMERVKARRNVAE
ncbi:MAG: hypothetical protein LBG24_06080 [Treponema sp.]|jgi:hypothetical protein|nr:hypothetical protein [Treponema sp.]